MDKNKIVIQKVEKQKFEGGGNMATLTYPCKAPIIIRSDKRAEFIEICKKATPTPERRAYLIKCAELKKKN